MSRFRLLPVNGGVEISGKPMCIEQDIAAWDGKSSADIKAVYDAHHSAANFSDKVTALLFTPPYEKGATWLLKAWLEAGNRLEPFQIAEIYRSLNQLQQWEGKLHLLQSIPFMPIAATECKYLYDFLRHTLTDQNKFVRAWSYNGFFELSRQHSEYLNETKQFFQMAIRDEAPSVKARIRNIMKTGF